MSVLPLPQFLPGCKFWLLQYLSCTANNIRLVLQKIFVLHCKQYLPRIANSIWLALQTICVSNFKQYFSCTANNISVTLQKIFVLLWKQYLSRIANNIYVTSQTIFVSYFKQNFSRIANNIFFTLQTIFVLHCKQYFSHILNIICLPLHVELVPHSPRLPAKLSVMTWVKEFRLRIRSACHFNTPLLRFVFETQKNYFQFQNSHQGLTSGWCGWFSFHPGTLLGYKR